MVSVALPRISWLDRIRTVQLNLGAHGALGVGVAQQRGGAAAANGLLTGLVAYWGLENNGNDELGALNLTGVSTIFGAGKINVGSAHDGTARYWATADFQMPTAFSMSLWFSIATKATTRFVCGQESPTAGGFNFRFTSAAGAVLFSAFNTSNAFLGSHGVLYPSTSTWYHAVMTYDTSAGGAMTVYYNGSSQGSVSFPTMGKPNRMYELGARPDTLGGNYWYGSIDEVGYWQRVLSQADVTALYSGGVGLPFSQFTS